MYYFKRTYTEVRQFAVGANSWEEAKKMLEDDQYQDYARITHNLEAGYTSQLRRTWSEKIHHCLDCSIPISTAQFSDDSNRGIVLSLTGQKCYTCWMKDLKKEMESSE